MPIVCCSAKTGVGVKELLDALVFCGLPPDAVHRTAVTADEKVVDVMADPAGPLVAQIFKTRIDPFVQKLSFIRIYSGTLKSNETVQAEGIRKGVKLGQLFEIQADKTEPVESAVRRPDRGRDEDGRPQDQHVAGRPAAAAHPFPRADGRHGDHAPRAAATRPRSPPPSARSNRKIPRSACTPIRRPRKWWPTA